MIRIVYGPSYLKFWNGCRNLVETTNLNWHHNVLRLSLGDFSMKIDFSTYGEWKLCRSLLSSWDALQQQRKERKEIETKGIFLRIRKGEEKKVINRRFAQQKERIEGKMSRIQLELEIASLPFFPFKTLPHTHNSRSSNSDLFYTFRQCFLLLLEDVKKKVFSTLKHIK